MEEQNKEQKIIQLFIKIILYLLLAVAFFSKYFVKEGEISTGAILIFLSAIFSLIALTIVYGINFRDKISKIYLAVVSILPFLLMLSFNLMVLYYGALDISYDDWGFFTKIPELFGRMMNAQSIVMIFEIVFILIVGWIGFILGIRYKNKKRKNSK